MNLLLLVIKQKNEKNWQTKVNGEYLIKSVYFQLHDL
jgi:hypothetical protein